MAITLGDFILNDIANAQYKSTLTSYYNDGFISKVDQNKSAIKLSYGEFKKYQDIKDKVLFTNHNLTNNLKPGFDRSKFIIDSQPIVEPNGAYAFFRQDYYSVTIDNSSPNWKLFETEYEDSVYVQKMPVYIQKITYGKVGLIT